MKTVFENKKKLAAWIIGIVAVCILLFLGVRHIDAVADAFSWCVKIVMPLLIGCAIAIIINVPMGFLETHLWAKSKKPFLVKLRRAVAFVLSLVLILGIFAGIIVIILPTLVDTVSVIIQSAIKIVDRINSISEEEIKELPFGQLILDIDWSHMLETMETWLKTQAKIIVNKLFGTVTSLLGVIIDLFVSVVFAVYLLFSKEKLKAQAKKIIAAWIPKKPGDWIVHAASVASENFRNFIVGQSLEAVVLGLLCLIGMLIFDFPYAAMVSTLVGVTAMIPIIGAFIGGGVGAFMILTVDPIKALWFVVYIIALQQIEGNLIYPKVMGDRVKLPAMWILAAVTIGGGVAGPVGILVSVPILSTISVLFREATEKREQKLALEMAPSAAGCESAAPSHEVSDTAPEGDVTPEAAARSDAPDPEPKEAEEKKEPPVKNTEQQKKRKKK